MAGTAEAPLPDVLFVGGAPLREGTLFPLDMAAHESRTYLVQVRAPPGRTVENIRVRSGVPSEMATVIAPSSVSSTGTIRITFHGRALFDAPADLERVPTTIQYDLARRFD